MISATRVIGKCAKQYAEGTNIVVLEPDVAKVFPDSAAVNQACDNLSSSGQVPSESEIATCRKLLQENERQLEDAIPKHVPLTIKIKKEKEAGFRDLNNERWAREFELEVTNTGSNRSIFCIFM